MTNVAVEPSVESIGSRPADISDSDGLPPNPPVDSLRNEHSEEQKLLDVVLDDECDICSYSTPGIIQKVKNCKFKENQEEYTLLLCKPCWASIEAIGS